MEMKQDEFSSSQLRSTITSLQDETIRFIIPVFLLAGLMILTTLTTFRDPNWTLVSAATLLLSGVCAWGLKKLSYLLAASILIAVSLLVVCLAVMWRGIGAAIVLVALPVDLCMLMISRKVGLLAAVLAVPLVFLLPLPASSVLDFDVIALRIISLVVVWSTSGMIWLVFQPLLSSVRWAWYGYERSQVLLEQSREYQARLLQAMEDLKTANSHLTRLNQLANSLRKVAEEERSIKTHFVANVSHELRTPLNMIIGFCEMIMQAPHTYGYALPPALLADLAVVLRNSQHLSSLINDVLDLSQIEAGQMALTKEWVNIEEIIKSALAAVQPLYQSKNLYLNTQMQENIPLVNCDLTRIREVLLNLLSNAGRFTDHGGVMVKAWIEGENLVISVEDTGMGIEPNLQEKLFQPFQQLEDRGYRHYGGSGLGLSISKHFVEMHEGKMWVTSEPGIGSTFFFRLPIHLPVSLDPGVFRWINPYQTQAYEEHPAPASQSAATIRPRIAVVEGREVLQRLLERYMNNIEICGFPALGPALQSIAQEPVSVLVMNSLDVNETLNQLNQNGQLPYGVPVIISSIPGAEATATNLGASEYLLKPISREKLLSAIKKNCPDARCVLIVDDEADARQLFARMLNAEGNTYRVLRASNGREALEILDSNTPDLILLDLGMPEMDGVQFLLHQSQDPRIKEIPVILISARDPTGQPVLTKSLSVFCQSGMSVREILDCIRAMTVILSKTGPTAGLVQTKDPGG